MAAPKHWQTRFTLDFINVVIGTTRRRLLFIHIPNHKYLKQNNFWCSFETAIYTYSTVYFKPFLLAHFVYKILTFLTSVFKNRINFISCTNWWHTIKYKIWHITVFELKVPHNISIFTTLMSHKQNYLNSITFVSTPLDTDW